jgi:hypothetical protein
MNKNGNIRGFDPLPAPAFVAVQETTTDPFRKRVLGWVLQSESVRSDWTRVWNAAVNQYAHYVGCCYYCYFSVANLNN